MWRISVHVCQGPVFADPIKKPEDVDRLNPNFDIIKELGYVYESITLTRQKLKGRVPLFGFTGAPVRTFEITLFP